MNARHTLLALLPTLGAIDAFAEEVRVAWPMRELRREGAVAREYTLDPQRTLPLHSAQEARMEDVEMPDGRLLDFALKRVTVSRESTFIGVDGFRSPDALESDLTMWSGVVDGEPGGHVFLAFSPYGTRGIIELNDRRYHLIARPSPDGDWSSGYSRLEVGLPDEDAMISFRCGQDEVEQPMRAPIFASPPPAGGDGSSAESPPPTSGAFGTIYACDIGVETDYQFGQIFGSNAKATANYVATLFGAISSLYYAEIGVVLRIAYLGVWTTNSDPWTTPESPTGNTSKMLTEFRTKWGGGQAPVDVPLYHHLSGASLGGGVAYLSAVCNTNYRFGISADFEGNLTTPVTQGYNTWDFVVCAHEIGHNFGTVHTHDYCPPLDQCAPNGYYGSCQTTQVCQQSTIMSYCHTCAGGMSNIQITFGNTVASTMRSFVTSNASCFDVVSTPDLHGTLCSGPSTGDSNGAITLQSTVANAGTPISGSFTYQLRLSSDSTITTADTLLGSVTNSVPGTQVTTNTTLPANLTPGGYYFGLTIDAASGETDLADNSFTGTAITISGGGSVPNLQASSISGPSSATIGDIVTITRYIVNVGTSYSGSFSYEVRLSTDSTITSGDTLVASTSSSTLGTMDLDVTIPQGLSAGTYTWGLIVTPVTDETITSDNAVAGGSISIGSGPGGALRFVAGDTLIGSIGSAQDVDSIYVDLVESEIFSLTADALGTGLFVDVALREPGSATFDPIGTYAAGSTADLMADVTGRHELRFTPASGTGSYTFSTAADYQYCASSWLLKLDADQGNSQGIAFEAIPGTLLDVDGKASKKIKGKGLVPSLFAPDLSEITLDSSVSKLGKKGFVLSDVLLDEVGEFMLYVAGVKGPGKPATIDVSLEFPSGSDTVAVD